MSHTGEPAGLAEAPPRDLTPLVAELRAVVGDDWVYTQEHQLRTYESDGLLQYHVIPGAAVLPGSAEEVQAVSAPQALAALADRDLAAFCLALLNTNEFVYVD